MSEELLDRGIYAIINKPKKLVYVGETQRNFLIRWIEHLNNISNHYGNADRTKLFLHKHTKFIVLKTMNDETYIKHDFFRYEQEAYEFYKKKGWGVASTHNYNIESNYKDHDSDDKILLERNRKANNQIALVLSTINSKHTNGSIILKSLYKRLEKEFGTNIDKIEGKSVLSRLNKEELEFILVDLYPRFYIKKLELVRTEYKKRDRQLSF